MATMVLSSAGSALGKYLPVPNGAALGRRAGNLLGRYIDNALFSRVPEDSTDFIDLTFQRSAYGKVIPLCYGTMKLAGNIIWALPVREDTYYRGGGKGTGALPRPSTSYSATRRRFASLAIALCAGRAQRLIRAYADDAPLNLSNVNYRFYTGSQTQEPDPLIVAQEGEGKAPAYRGLCYIVLEDFPLAEYNGRIPNFAFEIAVAPEGAEEEEGALTPEEAVTAVTIIPGAGEYVYDTDIQRRISVYDAGGVRVTEGLEKEVNRHQNSGGSDALAALDALQNTLPNVQWVSVIITWFATSLDVSACIVTPGVEFGDEAAEIIPDPWAVAGAYRPGAYVIGQTGDGTPRYGGTPSDNTLLRFFDELKARGYKIMAYPMLFVDTEDKPWRGRITGDAADIPGFFTKTSGYNAFILHYANLLKDKADAFVIGSEMIGLTAVRDDTAGTFPAVDAFVSLAAQVKGIVGAGVKVTYAADWSEYHHTEGGYYHLDPLWSSSDIDMVGIDAYFPLTDAPETDITLQDAIDGWTSGEGYDFYYIDEARTQTAPLSPEYAWKNIAWWHANAHSDPGSVPTGWVPASKPVWFTEYGFPSVDGATNQPNVFYDPLSSESAFPRRSRGETDFGAQRRGIIATETAWQGSTVVEQRFLWTWDARPYPVWPDREDVWADAALWEKGHWVQGKFGRARLSAVLTDALTRAGLALGDIDMRGAASRFVDGAAINTDMSASDFIGALSDAYHIDIIEKNGKITAVPREHAALVTLPAGAVLARKAGEAAEAHTARADGADIPSRTEIVYLDRERGYESNARSAFADNDAPEDASFAPTGVASLRLPFVMRGGEARTLAETLLARRRAEREGITVAVEPSYAYLTPGDNIAFAGEERGYKISRIHHGADGLITLDAFALPAERREAAAPEEEDTPAVPEVLDAPARLALSVLNLPVLPGAANERALTVCIGALGDSSGAGASIEISADGGGSYITAGQADATSLFGSLIADTGAASPFFADERNTLTVAFRTVAEPESIERSLWRAGQNMLALAGEIILFREAVYLAPYRYRFSGLIRGAYGTEDAIAAHPAGTEAVIPGAGALAADMSAYTAGTAVIVRATPFGGTEEEAVTQTVTYEAAGLLPFAPAGLCGRAQPDGSVIFSWIRRPRTRNGWGDYSDAPRIEESEIYVFKVRAEEGGEVIREAQTVTASFTYTAAMQTADGFGGGGTAYISAAQLSAEVGAGKEKTTVYVF